MNRHAYQRVLGSAHAVRMLARQVAGDGLLDEAIAVAAASDEALLRAVRMLARLGADNGLAGEGIASPPVSGAGRRPADGSSSSPGAPSPAETLAFDVGSAARRSGPAASGGGA